MKSFQENVLESGYQYSMEVGTRTIHLDGSQNHNVDELAYFVPASSAHVRTFSLPEKTVNSAILIGVLSHQRHSSMNSRLGADVLYALSLTSFYKKELALTCWYLSKPVNIVEIKTIIRSQSEKLRLGHYARSPKVRMSCNFVQKLAETIDSRGYQWLITNWGFFKDHQWVKA